MSRAIPRQGWVVETDQNERALAALGWMAETAVVGDPPVASAIYHRVMPRSWVVETTRRQLGLPRFNWIVEQAVEGTSTGTISDAMPIPADEISASASEIADPAVDRRHYSLLRRGWVVETSFRERALPTLDWLSESISEQAVAVIADIDEVATPVPGDVINAAPAIGGTFVEGLAAPLDVMTGTVFEVIGVSVEEFTFNAETLSETPELAPPQDVINANAAFRKVRLTLRKRVLGTGTLASPGASTATFAFWDSTKPNLLTTAPIAKGTCTINADGTVLIDVPNSTLAVGGVGYVTISSTDGNPANNWLHFSGPVTVE